MLRLLFSLVWWATLVGAAAVVAVAVITAAPVPTVRPVKPPATLREGPVTADDLRRVRWLVYHGQRYPLRIELETALHGYRCDQYVGATPHGDGCRRYWGGNATMEDGVVYLSEGYYRERFDDLPELLYGPARVALEVRWEAGELKGTGWHSPVRLLREGE